MRVAAGEDVNETSDGLSEIPLADFASLSFGVRRRDVNSSKGKTMTETRSREFSLEAESPSQLLSKCHALDVDGIRAVQLPCAPVQRPLGQYLLVVTRVMMRTLTIPGVLTALAFAGILGGCKPGGVGDPCTPEDEYLADFSGFSVEEVNVESRSFQCETRICLVNHFQGRVSCPYGNEDSTTNKNADLHPPACVIPGSSDPITVPVDPQVKDRRANNAVYCSCRCDGPDSNARYCECPSGFSCAKLVDKFGFEKGGQLAGSYCIREGSDYKKGAFESCRYGGNNGGNCDSINGDGTPVD